MKRLFSSIAILGLCALASACTPEQDLKAELQEANYCETKDDCVLIGSKCPFDCYVYVNKAEADEMKGKLDAFESQCQYSCIASSGVACTDHKCVAVVDMPTGE